MSEPTPTPAEPEPERDHERDAAPQGDCTQPGGCVSTPTYIIERPARRAIPCEVYSRIVGYITPVQTWNLAKKQEMRERKLYDQAAERG